MDAPRRRGWRELDSARRPRDRGPLWFYIAANCALLPAAVLASALGPLSWGEAAGLWVVGVLVAASISVAIEYRVAARRIEGLARSGRTASARSLAKRSLQIPPDLADAREAINVGTGLLLPPTPMALPSIGLILGVTAGVAGFARRFRPRSLL